jgi:hypothetical protein
MEENQEDEHFTMNILYSLPHNYKHTVDQIKKNVKMGISNRNFSRKARRGGGGNT